MKSDSKLRLHIRFIQSYKKNTFAIFFSFVLTFLLLTSFLILLHTNHRVSNIQDKTQYTPSDCYIEEVSEKEINDLRKDTSIAHLAVEQAGYETFERNHQKVFLTKGDHESITMMAKVVKGRLPEQEGEVAAEKWVLLNLGIVPKINQSISIENPETGEEKQVELVGILSDMFGNKKYGNLNLYAPLDRESTESFVVYLQFKDGVDYDNKIKALEKELHISEKQIKECPAREDLKGLYRTDAQVIGVILVICMIIFYGIYRIASVARMQQYGVLRAVGMKKQQILRMLLAELYQIYWVSVPCGIVLGYLTASFVITFSGDRDLNVYLYNEKIPFEPVIPLCQIFICIVLVAVFIGILVWLTANSILSLSIVDTIAGVPPKRKLFQRISSKWKSRIFAIKRTSGKTSTLFRLGGKYIFKDIKISGFVILTIALEITLFTGLSYRAQTLKIYREDTKEMWHLNGEYAMTMLRFDSAGDGMSRASLEEIKKIKEVASIKTASGMPVRVIDEDGIKRNDTYYDKFNNDLMEIYGYCKVGNDGENQIYKSILYGYNEAALESLRKYIIDGDFDAEHIAEDEVILSVLRTDDTKENKNPGSYREGTPLIQYKAGDTIRIKYRKDFETGSLAYEELTDRDADYVYKTYKIAAIVSFPYMYDCNRTVYPLLITSDRHLQNLAPDSGIQCAYVDSKDNSSDESAARHDHLEEQLIRICSKNNNISTRSLISEINQNEMFYQKQMIYVYGMAIVVFVLVLINITNNLRYRMQTRTKEVSMLRAIGMSVSMIRKTLIFENMTLGIVSVILAFILTHPVLKYLYKMSQMRAFGHPFSYDYTAFFLVAFAALVINGLLPFNILKSWKTKRIVEIMGKVE